LIVSFSYAINIVELLSFILRDKHSGIEDRYLAETLVGRHREPFTGDQWSSDKPSPLCLERYSTASPSTFRQSAV